MKIIILLKTKEMVKMHLVLVFSYQNDVQAVSSVSDLILFLRLWWLE